MTNQTSKLGCASSLFQCFSSKKKRSAAADQALPRQAPSPATIQSNETTENHEPRVRFQPSQQDASCPHSPTSVKSEKESICSDKSGRSSVYLDALEDHPDFNDVDSCTDSTLIDGEYFFSAKDDAAFESIKQYPPIPTTAPDVLTKYPVTSSDMQTLLYEYQHSDVDEEEEKKETEGQHLVGEAMEHQARALLSVTREENSKIFESTNLLLDELKVPQVKVRERGYPGELTEEELEAVKLFKKELEARDPIYYEIVCSFSPVEKEAYALCRFLRARKFDVEKVFELLDEAKDGFRMARDEEFYPDFEKELGFPKSVFLSQYPAVFSGNARNGCPVMYLRAGEIEPEGVKCLVTVDKVDRYFWNDIMYNFCPLIGEGRKINPNLVRCENINIYDLKGVSRAQFTSDTFDMIKVGNQVMTSFPETLHCLLIINAPSWFGLIWSIVKKLIDPRTASKIEVFTNSKSGIDRMNELIEDSQIPSDYGGSGPSLSASASAAGKITGNVGSGGDKRKIVVFKHLFQLTKKQNTRTHQFTVEAGQLWTLNVYTRCQAGVNVALQKGDSDHKLISIDVVGDSNEQEQPYSRTIGTCTGPDKYTLKVIGKVPGSFLIIGTMDANGFE